MQNQSCSNYISLIFLITLIGLPACYAPQEFIPEARKPKEKKLWTDADVDAVVEMSYLSIDATEAISTADTPEVCNKVGFLRFRNRFGPEDAEQTDAALLMVPGILEGANGFEFIGRQMVYMAQREYGKNIEVWAMDRRANCLEDLTGMEAADKVSDSIEAEDILIDYYYRSKQIDGKTFAGFLSGPDLALLYEFGMRQTTLDMAAIIRHMMPTPGISKQKLFVGGHSLGGTHTSVFLAWDFDGDTETLDDAGYNMVAGAFGFDTQVSRLDQASFIGTNGKIINQMLADKGLVPLRDTIPDSASGYETSLKMLADGIIPPNLSIPELFTPEILALPELVGIPASKAPDAESGMYDKVPQSAALTNMVNLIHSRNALNVGVSPLISDFRYTNRAYVGLIFDDNFQQLAFLKLGIGFLDGGAIERKWDTGEETASNVLVGGDKMYIAADAGEDSEHFGSGPLYDWVSRSETGDASDPAFLDTTGMVQLTELESEPAEIDDLIRALHIGPTNLTEWYFPMRILLDINAVNKSFAADYGLQTLHPSGVANIPSLILTAGDGVEFDTDDFEAVENQTVIVAPGYTHMDPMFEAVNSPSQTSYVMRPLLDFVLQ